MDVDGPTRLTRRIAPWFEEAFRQAAFGERMLWEITVAVTPGQNGQLMPALMLYIEAPAATLGNSIVEMVLLPVIRLDHGVVQRAVREAVGRIMKQRSDELSALKTQRSA